jgi:hypothetical protein
MRLIEQIGAYAGLAAIPGLAILSALYFSQARDVRRLREWAGRAPERASEQASGGRVAAQPQQVAPAQPAQPAKPGQAVQPGQAAKPAGAVATPGQVAQPGAAAAGATAGAVAAGAAAKPASAAGVAAAAAKPAVAAGAAGAAAKTPAGAAASAAGAAAGTVTRPGPPAVGGARPATGVRRPAPRLPSSQTSILAPPERPPWYRRLPAARYIALVIAGLLVVGGGVAFAITQLASNDGGGSSSGNGAATPAAKKQQQQRGNTKATPQINPADVTVTVVNGTTIANLARDTASRLRTLGFQTGNVVTGTGPLAAAESVVKYKPGASAEAKLVADKLHISQKEPADADAINQAGPASVIVVLGADQAPGG